MYAYFTNTLFLLPVMFNTDTRFVDTPSTKRCLSRLFHPYFVDCHFPFSLYNRCLPDARFTLLVSGLAFLKNLNHHIAVICIFTFAIITTVKAYMVEVPKFVEILLYIKLVNCTASLYKFRVYLYGHIC